MQKMAGDLQTQLTANQEEMKVDQMELKAELEKVKVGAAKPGHRAGGGKGRYAKDGLEDGR